MNSNSYTVIRLTITLIFSVPLCSNLTGQESKIKTWDDIAWEAVQNQDYVTALKYWEKIIKKEGDNTETRVVANAGVFITTCVKYFSW